MRNRLFEISAVLVGVAIVVAIYLFRQDDVTEPAAEIERPIATSPEVELKPVESLPASDAGAAGVTSAPTPEPELPVVDPAEIAEARTVWQAAVADLEAVEAELDVLDTRFDAKEAELGEMESQGMDPELLEEEMMIFLDGIVDEYDELETRLAEAEAVEASAAERLAELQGDVPR